MNRDSVARAMVELAHEGLDDAQKAKVEDVIKNLPDKTYNAAVIFLGIATVSMVIGAVVLAAIDKSVDALWGALGAGIGGLAGIFMGSQ